MIKELTINQPGIHEIRPKILLKSAEDLFKAPIDIVLHLPSSDIGSLTTLEATMIVALLKIFNPSKIFEFGTFLGYTTSILTRNSKDSSIVFSLDLDVNSNQVNSLELNEFSNQDVLTNDIINDAFLSKIQSVKGEFYLSDMSALQKSRIKLLKQNSLELDVNNLSLVNEIDFCFIDGGHTYEIVKSDTEKAFLMAKKNSIILWHDYNSKIHGDVTSYLMDLSDTYTIYHIANTMLAFTIINNQ
jgi:hypothetical protein